MDWSEYKALSNQPFTFSRWMLEQTIELIQEDALLAEVLAKVLRGPMIAKPIDHSGGRFTDMFELRIDVDCARAIHRLIGDAALSGRRTAATRARGLGGFAAAWREYADFVGSDARAAQDRNRTHNSTQPADVVTNLIDAFNANDLDRIMSHFANHAVYHNMLVAPVSGHAAIRTVLQRFLGQASRVDWQLRHIAATATGVVLTERVDRLLINDRWLEIPVMGTFEIAGTKITAWRDYFDMNQFQSQLAR
jgi:limonene-1,2-epoxide hydrolase